MRQEYEIPAKGIKPLGVGQWVEIFESYGDVEGKRSIRVRCMRVEGRMWTFSGEADGSAGSRALKPHEGRVSHVEQDEKGMRFRISLRS